MQLPIGIRPGRSESVEIEFTQAMIDDFARLSGDTNPLHTRQDFARSIGFHKPVAHGALQVAIVSMLIGMRLPGPGALWRSLSIEWLKPVFVGDRATVTLTIRSASGAGSVILMDIAISSSAGDEIAKGNASVKILTPNQARTPKSKKRGVVLVTGASGAVGSSIVRALSSQGYRLALLYNRRPPELSKSFSSAVTLFRCDLSQNGAAADAVRRVISDCDDLYGIVHAAVGPISPASCEKITRADFDQQMAIGPYALSEMMSVAMGSLVASGRGRIVAIGTSAMQAAPPVGWGAYLTAKHAMWGYIRNCAIEFGRYGVTSNMVSPTMMVSELTANIPHSIKEVEAARNPVRRLADPEDVASAVAYLFSSEAGFINGQNIFLSGGAV